MKAQKATDTATAETAETATENKTYDVAKHDEMRDLGFRTDLVASGFVAHEILGDRRVPENGGGFETIDQLITAVRAEVQKTGIAATALQEEPSDGDAIVTEQTKPGVWVAYRKGDPELRGAGPTWELAAEDLKIAEEEANSAAFAGRSENAFPTRPDFNLDEIAEHLDEIEETATSDDEALDAIGQVIGEANDIETLEQDEDERDDAPAPASPTIEILEDVGGQSRLPGQPRVINHELTAAALKYHSIKMERVRLSGEEKAAKDELRIASIRHADMFVPDPDNTDSKIYNAGQLPSGKIIIVRDKKVYEEAITTEEVSAMPKPDKKAKKPKK